MDCPPGQKKGHCGEMGVSCGSTVNIIILHFSLLTERIIIMACVYVKDAHLSEKTKECLPRCL